MLRVQRVLAAVAAVWLILTGIILVFGPPWPLVRLAFIPFADFRNLEETDERLRVLSFEDVPDDVPAAEVARTQEQYRQAVRQTRALWTRIFTRYYWRWSFVLGVVGAVVYGFTWFMRRTSIDPDNLRGLR